MLFGQDYSRHDSWCHIECTYSVSAFGSGRIGTQRGGMDLSHHSGFPCPVVCTQAFCICIDKCDSSPVLEVLKEKFLPKYEEGVGQPFSRGVSQV